MKYSFEEHMKPIIEGKVALPNAKVIDRDVGAAILHYNEMHCGQVLLQTGRKWNVRYFLDYGQGGGLHGSGLVAWTDWKDGAYRAVGMMFAICDHTQVTSSSPSAGCTAARVSRSNANRRTCFSTRRLRRNGGLHEDQQARNLQGRGFGGLFR